MEKAIITTSWDDCHPSNIKLGKLLKKYSIPATFYIPIKHIGLGRKFKYFKRRETMTPEQIKKLSKNFDIGGHTFKHTDLTKVSPKKAKEEILEGKKTLEKLIRKEIISFCYPYGNFNEKVVDVLKKIGFKGARTTSLFTRKIENSFKMGTMIQAAQRSDWSYAYNFIKQFLKFNDLRLSQFILKKYLFNKPWDQIAIETLEFVMKNGGIWHLYGHSWEIDGNNDWKKLEKLFRKIKNMKKDAKLMSNSDLLQL